MKKICLFLIAFLTLCFVNADSFAFLESKTINGDNVISTGNFPKIRIKLYSAAGPVFKETLSGHENQQSLSYQPWLTDASKYIIKDMTGQVLDTPAPKDQYETYENIENDSKNISRRNTIISANFYSWKGVYINSQGGSDYKKERGITMHHIVVMENSKRLGKDSSKIKLSDLRLDGIGVSIIQYDMFKGRKGEYKVQRQGEMFLPGDSQNSTRVRTYDFVKGQYVRSFKGENGKVCYNNQSTNGNLPADEADMILFDAGAEGYCAESGDKGKLTEQQVLDQLYDRLCGNLPHADLNNGKYDIHYQNNTPIHDAVEKMIANNDLKCKLDRSICDVKLIKDGKIIFEKINTIYFDNQ